MENELLQDLIKTGIQAIKENKENQKISEQKDIIDTTENTLLEQKKAIVKKYVEKKINDPILQLTWVAEDYLISENFRDKAKDNFVFEKFIEKSNLESKILEEMKDLKKSLASAEKDAAQNNESIETRLNNIESRLVNNETIIPVKQENLEDDKKDTEEVVQPNQEQTTGNFDTLPEKYKSYITTISSKFPDPKKSNIKTYGPTVIQEALKHDETKKIIPKIFAQINKESWRNSKALNDKWEYSIGFMQINKNAGHTWKINGEYYDLEKPEGNIAYGISFLAECIRRSNGNIRRGFNIYNWWANLTKPEKEQYAHSIMNDRTFKDQLA